MEDFSTNCSSKWSCIKDQMHSINRIVSMVKRFNTDQCRVFAFLICLFINP